MSAAPLGVTIASYAGDATTTQSESALAGSDVTYQVTVSNAGPGTQTNVVVPVDLPAAFTLGTATVSGSAGSTTVSGNVVTWSIPSLAGGTSATLTYTETTDAPAALESDTTSASASSDQTTTPSTASAAVEVIPAADLTIAVSDGVSSIAPGASDTYTITLTDNGPSAATNATVTDTFNGAFAASSDAQLHRRDDVHRPRWWPVPVDRHRPGERRQRNAQHHGNGTVAPHGRQRVREPGHGRARIPGRSTPIPSTTRSTRTW